MNVKSEPQLNPSSYVVLGLLDYQPDATGYELRQLADRTVSFLWATPSMSQIYAELDRLHASGYVRRKAESATKRPRITHRLTAKGRTVLRKWAASPEYEAPTFHHVVALRVLLGRSAGTEIAALLEQHLTATRHRLEGLRELADLLGPQADVDDGLSHARIVAEWGDSFFAAELEATRRALKRLSE
jgi:DNA-binding PadR family transcriptional regulator